MAQEYTFVGNLGSGASGLAATLELRLFDVLTGAAEAFASEGSDSGSVNVRTTADDDTWIVEGAAGAYTVRCTAYPDDLDPPVRVDLIDPAGPTTLASGVLAQIDIDGADLSGIDLSSIEDLLSARTIYATGSAPDEAATLSIRRTAKVVATIAAPGISGAWVRLYVSIKRKKGDPDEEALVLLRVSNPADAGEDGLLYIERKTVADAGLAKTDGSISDVDTGAETVEITLLPLATKKLEARGAGGELWFDVKQALAADDTDIAPLVTAQGAEIIEAVTQRTS